MADLKPKADPLVGKIQNMQNHKKSSKKSKGFERYFTVLIECCYTYKSAYKKYLHQPKVQRMFEQIDQALARMEEQP